MADLTSDGTRLAFKADFPGSRGHIQEVRIKVLPNGPERALVTGDLNMEDGPRLYLRWSPNGSRLAYRYQQHSKVGVFTLDFQTGAEKPLTSLVDFKDRETPSGWSWDGRFVIASSFRHKPGHASIVLLPVDEAPTAERRAITITDSSDYNLWNATMSPNRKWIVLNATTPGPQRVSANPIGTTPFGQTSRLAVVSSQGGRWIEITDGTSWDDKPRWSMDGRVLYFFSDRGGVFNVWGIGFDPNNGRPIGTAFPVSTLGALAQQAPELAIGGGRLAFATSSATGGIWMIDHLRH
jgi:Tol biopolymer transport system component